MNNSVATRITLFSVFFHAKIYYVKMVHIYATLTLQKENT